ncbi:MAG: threonine/serine dehydratase [Alphaproteobacteria bacterium]|nr:threonine/serine dehydratase [Alphaproteobacteria bacterium]
MGFTLAEFRAAAARIKGLVRRTPMMQSCGPVTSGPDIALKLECLQITGSFKPRGAVNALKSLPDEAIRRGIITASGGNHGKAVAYAGRIAKTRAVVYLPKSAPPEKAATIRAFGAEPITFGEVWDDSNAEAKRHAEREGMTYIHPFGDEPVILGQGTLGLEVLEDLPEVDIVLTAIGGGGFAAGVATAIKAAKPGVRIIGIEPVGAPTLHDSVKAGKLVTLDRIESRVSTLSAKRSDQINLDLIGKNVERIVLVTDEQMRDAARWLWKELGIAAELSGAASVAALLTGKVELPKNAKVCAVICGAGSDGIG